MLEPGKASASVSACVARLGGVEGGCIHSGLGEVAQKKQNEVLTIDGAVLKSAQKVGLLNKGDQGKSTV